MFRAIFHNKQTLYWSVETVGHIWVLFQTCSTISGTPAWTFTITICSGDLHQGKSQETNREKGWGEATVSPLLISEAMLLGQQPSRNSQSRGGSISDVGDVDESSISPSVTDFKFKLGFRYGQPWIPFCQRLRASGALYYTVGCLETYRDTSPSLQHIGSLEMFWSSL